MQFELLGLDDKDIQKAYQNMSRMVVEDLNDDCFTILCPSRLARDIYRIWCSSIELKNKQGGYEYFPNEYKEFPNPRLEFGKRDVIEWSVGYGDGFEIQCDGSVESTKNALDEYYVSILRTDNGEILNEKRYILPPTRISDAIVGNMDDGYYGCNISRWQTASVDDEDKFVNTQLMIVGTQEPFNFNEDGSKNRSRSEELQYGNGICGVGSLDLKIDIDIQESLDGNSITRIVRPSIRINRSPMGDSLVEKVERSKSFIEPGSFTIIISHRNLDNIAKYHILNNKSSLYYNSSLPKSDGFKYSDFIYSKTVELSEESDGTFKSADGALEFSLSDVNGDVPPYHIDDSNGNPIWMLEQSELNQNGLAEFVNARGTEHQNSAFYGIPSKGKFKWAHKIKAKPEKYIDYLYVKRGSLAFKVNEESESFADALTKIPPFYIDEVLRNKLQDLNDVQIQKEYSTFIHQSERPDGVRECKFFNPLVVDAVLKYGLLEDDSGSSEGSTVKTVCDEFGKPIELDNSSDRTRVELNLEDGEIDSLLKVYANYVRIDDGNGDFHYDLYFNIQNLLNSPFEYISSVTNQPNVLILKDSYLYLSGDKYKRVYDKISKTTHNEIDKNKLDAIKNGGILSIYGQVKTYCSDDSLLDVKTIKLFQYRVYNISDDKPKFLIKKIYDITKTAFSESDEVGIDIEFSDVMWQIEENQFNVESDGQKFKTLKDDIMVVQPIKVRCDSDSLVKEISFDIVNDVIDFGAVPKLYGYWNQSMGLLDENGKHHYDRWSDDHMSLKWDSDRNVYRMTLRFGDGGFNFETIYLKWCMPSGFSIMDTIDRLGGHAFRTTAQNCTAICNEDSTSVDFNVRTGKVAARVPERKEMYLGLEHSTTKRLNGYVLVGMADLLENAIKESDIKRKCENGENGK